MSKERQNEIIEDMIILAGMQKFSFIQEISKQEDDIVIEILKKYERKKLKGEEYRKAEVMHERIKEFTLEFGLDLRVGQPIGIYASYYKELDLYVLQDPNDNSQEDLIMYISKDRRIFLYYHWYC